MNRSRARVSIRLLAVGGIMVALSGCFSTRNALFVEIDEQASFGDYATAAARVEQQRAELYGARDRVLYHLDAGMLAFYARDYGTSIQQFNEAEHLIEEFFTRSVSQAAGSFLLNDTVIDYPGEDFENIYLNVFKAIAFIELGDIDAAFVEVRRINNKLNLLEDRNRGLANSLSAADEAVVAIEPGESEFYNSALARYLSLLMYRAEGDLDGARIDWLEMQEAFALQQNLYGFPLPFDARVIEPPKSGAARLSVLAFAGRAPVKRAETLWVTTLPNEVQITYAEESTDGLVLPQRYQRFPFPGVEGGYRFKFQVPRMQPRGSLVDRIRVLADGSAVGEVALLENMEQIAVETFRVREPIIFMKTVVRTIVKGVLAQEGQRQIENAVLDNGTPLALALGIIGSIATDVAVEASEVADLRMSRFFPAYTYSGEWELEPGQYRFEVEYWSGGQLLYVDPVGEVEVAERGLNLVTSHLTR